MDIKMISKRDKTITVILMVVIGTCMHFVHELIPSGGISAIVGCIFPVNETSWEHMKMIWYPFLVAGIIYSCKTRCSGYFAAFVICAFAAMMMQLGAFAMYQSLTGTTVLVLDIIIYGSSMVCCILLAFELAQKAWTCKYLFLWVAAALIITSGIVFLTFHPGSGYVFMDNSDFHSHIIENTQ